MSLLPGAYLSSDDNSDDQDQLIQTDSDDGDFNPDQDIIFEPATTTDEDDDEGELEGEGDDDDDADALRLDEDQDTSMPGDNDQEEDVASEGIRIAFDGESPGPVAQWAPPAATSDDRAEIANNIAVVVHSGQSKSLDCRREWKYDTSDRSTSSWVTVHCRLAAFGDALHFGGKWRQER